MMFEEQYRDLWNSIDDIAEHDGVMNRA